MKSALHALALCLALSAIGCARWAPVPTMVIGPMRGGASLSMYRRMVLAARTAGYPPEDVVPRFGSFAVLPHSSAPGVRFEVQCFADGRVEVRIAGAERGSRTGLPVVPDAVRAELMTLVDALDEAGTGGLH